MATVSFQGIASKIQTDNLVNAVIAQEGKGVAALEVRQTRNKAKTTALNSLKSSLNSLSISFASLQDAVNSGDKTAATNAMQEVVNKYNAFVKLYKDSSVSTRNTDGSVNQGPLANDPTSRAVFTQVRAAVTAAPEGVVDKNLSSIGIRTMADGTLSLSTSTFQTEFTSNIETVKSLTAFSTAKSTITSVVGFSVEGVSIAATLSRIEEQNKNLSAQISAGQAALEKRRKELKAQFSKMEVTIAQLNSAAGQLGGTV